MIAGDDPTPWTLLADGTIVRLERDLADVVSVWVDAPFLRSRFGDGGTLFRCRLLACSALVYTPYDEPPITDLAAIASSEPTIGKTVVRDGELVIEGSAGTLRARYAEIAVELDTGSPITVEQLQQAVARRR